MLHFKFSILATIIILVCKFLGNFDNILAFYNNWLLRHWSWRDIHLKYRYWQRRKYFRLSKFSMLYIVEKTSESKIINIYSLHKFKYPISDRSKVSSAYKLTNQIIEIWVSTRRRVYNLGSSKCDPSTKLQKQTKSRRRTKTDNYTEVKLGQPLISRSVLSANKMCLIIGLSDMIIHLVENDAVNICIFLAILIKCSNLC